MQAGRIRMVGAILVEDGKLLLGLRSAHRQSHPGAWDIIGGHVEPGERDMHALVRELEEEIGVTPVRAWPICAADIGDTHTLLVYLVDAWTGGAPALTNDEHSSLDWFTPAEASALGNLAAEQYRDIFAGLRL